MSKDDLEAEKEALVQGYVEGALTPAESARLGELLRGDPLLARMIVENLQMEGAIREITDGEAYPVAVPRVKLSDSQKIKSTRRFRTARSVAPAGWNPLVVAAIAAVALIGLLFLFTSSTPETDPGAAARRQKQEEKRRAWERQMRENQERVRRAEEQLQQNQRRRESLFLPAATRAKDPVAEEKKQQDLRSLDVERAKVEEELKDAIRKFNQAKEEIERPEVEEKAIVRPDEPAGSTTVASAATVLPDGEVYVVSGQERTLIQTARALGAGEGLATGAGASQARIVFPDRSLVVVGPGTSIAQIRGGAHKLVDVQSGSVRAQIMRQAAGSMSFSSPYGVAKVLGTSLRIVVDPTGPGSMRLEVTEGKVQLQRMADKKTVDVPSGHYAVAVAGGELVSRPMLIDDILLYPMQGLVSGADWQTVEDPLATAGIALEATLTSPRIKSPGLVSKTRPDHVAFTFQADPYRDYAVRIKGANTGWVAVSIPGASIRPAMSGTGAFPFPSFGVTSGYVWVGGEGTSATLAVRFTGSGTRTLKLYAAEAPVRVDSIWLTAIKNPTETQLDKTGEVTVLFGPETRPMPVDGEYLLDSAKEFDATRGYGWVGPLPWTDIDLTKPKSDLHMSFAAGGNKTLTHTWHCMVPNGKYFVTVSCGVYNAFAQGPHMVRIQDKPVVNLAQTKIGEFYENPVPVPVEVKDGRLVMVIGGHQSNIKPPDKSDDTIINYLKLRRMK